MNHEKSVGTLLQGHADAAGSHNESSAFRGLQDIAIIQEKFGVSTRTRKNEPLA